MSSFLILFFSPPLFQSLLLPPDPYSPKKNHVRKYFSLNGLQLTMKELFTEGWCQSYFHCDMSLLLVKQSQKGNVVNESPISNTIIQKNNVSRNMSRLCHVSILYIFRFDRSYSLYSFKDSVYKIQQPLVVRQHISNNIIDYPFSLMSLLSSHLHQASCHTGVKL